MFVAETPEKEGELVNTLSALSRRTAEAKLRAAIFLQSLAFPPRSVVSLF